MSTVQSLIDTMEKLAPPGLAETWDPVGLQLGDPQATVRRVLLTLDVTSAALAAARDQAVQLIICHHPLIFTPLKTLLTGQPEQRLIRELVQADLAVFAAHTNLDATPGGVADALADALGLPVAGRTVLVPTGQWVGNQPAGHGRLAPFSGSLQQFRQAVSQCLGSGGSRLNVDASRPIRRVAVCPGSFDESWVDILSAQAVDVLVTGELKHHVGLLLAARGIAAIDTGHDVSERVVLAPLAARLRQNHPEISFAVHTGLDYNKMAF